MVIVVLRLKEVGVESKWEEMKERLDVENERIWEKGWRSAK